MVSLLSPGSRGWGGETLLKNCTQGRYYLKHVFLGESFIKREITFNIGKEGSDHILLLLMVTLSFM